MKKQGQAGAARQEEWNMTANEVHEAALALLFENRATAGDYNTFALPLFNLLLPELLETENGLRRAAGREELEQAPLLGSLEEQIPYDERLLRGALPTGWRQSSSTTTGTWARWGTSSSSMSMPSTALPSSYRNRWWMSIEAD